MTLNCPYYNKSGKTKKVYTSMITKSKMSGETSSTRKEVIEFSGTGGTGK